jgi:hypothetical protein
MGIDSNGYYITFIDNVSEPTNYGSSSKNKLYYKKLIKEIIHEPMTPYAINNKYNLYRICTIRKSKPIIFT